MESRKEDAPTPAVLATFVTPPTTIAISKYESFPIPHVPYAYPRSLKTKGYQRFQTQQMSSRLPGNQQCQISFLGLLDCRNGLALKSQGLTVGALVAVLTTSFVLFGVQLLLFLAFRTILCRIYSPKSYLGPRDDEKISLPKKGIVNWLWSLSSTQNLDLVRQSSLDAYFFLRYLRLLLLVFLPGAVIVVPILLPLNRGADGSQKGLDRLSISNTTPTNARRLWVHVLVTIAFIIWACYITRVELQQFVVVRHDALISRRCEGAAVKTVLVSGIPRKLQDPERIRSLLNVLPGGVRRVRIHHDLRQLREKVAERDAAIQDLEKAETVLVQLCHQRSSPHDTVGMSSFKKLRGYFEDLLRQQGFDMHHSSPETHEALSVEQDHQDIEMHPSPHVVRDGEKPRPQLGTHPCRSVRSHSPDCSGEKAVWREYIEPSERPTTRLPLTAWSSSWFPSMPSAGKKVDLIDHLRGEVFRLSGEIERLKIEGLIIESTVRNEKDKPSLGSALVEFNHQVGAHVCCQSLVCHRSTWMSCTMLDPTDDILWHSIGISWHAKQVRKAGIFAVSGLLLAIYAIPVAFSSLLGRIGWLAHRTVWLLWLASTPDWLLSALQGILPPVVLSLVLASAPSAFRFLAGHEGVITKSAQEVRVQRWYFAFLFFQVFVVVTISGGIFETVADAATEPASYVRQLGVNLPKASNYFLSYATTQALSGSASALLQIPTLISWLIIAPLWDFTAREKWRRQTSLATLQWGTFYPPVTNLAAIGIIYAILSPLMLIFMVFAILLFCVAFHYNFLYVYGFQHNNDGQTFPIAVNQLYTGIYFLELCLAGFFLTLIDDDGRLVCLPHAVIMTAAFAVTIWYHNSMNSALGPAMKHLPMTVGEQSAPDVPVSDHAASTSDASWTGAESCQNTSSNDQRASYSPGRFRPRMTDLDRCEYGSQAEEVVAAGLTVVWIPEDRLGISKDEIRCMNNSRENKDAVSTTVGISDKDSSLDDRAQVTFKDNPPDQKHRLPRF